MKDLIKNIKEIFFLIEPVWRKGKKLILLSLLNAVILEPIQVISGLLFTQIMIDSIVSKVSWNKIILIILFFFIVSIGVILIQRAIDILYNQEKTMEIQAFISYKIYVQSLRTDYKYFDDSEFYNDYTWAVNEYPRQVIQITNFVLSFCNSLISILFLTAYISILSPLIIFSIMIFIVISIFISIYQNKLDIQRRNEFLKQDRKMSYIKNIFYQRDKAADLRTTNLKEFLFNQHEKIVENKKKIYKKYNSRLYRWSWVQHLLIKMNDFIIVGYIAYGILNGNIDNVGVYASLVSASTKLANGIYNLFDHFTQLSQLHLYSKKIRTFFNLQSNIEYRICRKECPVLNVPFKIEFKNVFFSYKNSQMILKNFCMTIEPGERIALVGENGVGKSTIIKLLLGLYNVDLGMIMYNGKSITEYNIAELRAKIGAVFQTINIYAMSIAENLQIYRKMSIKEMIDTLCSVKLDYILKREYVSLETEVTHEFNNKGIVFSEGEIQKIGLARIINGNFGLLLLDESSSSLDPIAEYELNQRILEKSQNVTTVIVAHRLSSIRDADKIYFIGNGKVMESGTHDELMKNKGRYYEMFIKQSKKYIIN